MLLKPFILFENHLVINMKSIDEYKRIAMGRILPAGVKPEDYHFVDPTFPIRISKLIVDEIYHLIEMDRIREKHGLEEKTYEEYIKTISSIQDN